MTASRHYVAVLIMMAGAFFASLLSLVSVLSSEIGVFTLLTFSGFLASATHIPFIFRRKKGFRVKRRFLVLSMLGGVCVSLGYALFTMSVRTSENPLIPTIIFEMYPIGIILLSGLFIKKESFGLSNVFWLLVSAIGVATITLSISDGVFILDANSSFYLSLIAVALLSIGAVLVSSAFKDRESDLYSAILASFYARVGGLLVTAFLMIFEPTSIAVISNSIWYIVLYGFLILGLTNICYYSAIYLSKTHLINNIWYLTPVLGIVWLWMFSLGEFTQNVAVGATLVITSNLMMNLSRESKLSYSVTVTSIIIFGIFILATKGFGTDYYFDAVATPVLFFALLFGFVVDRMQKRLSIEQTLILKLINKSDRKDNTRIEKILSIGQESNLSKIKTIYHSLLSSPINCEDDADIDELVLSKTHSINTGELFVILLTGLLSIFTAVIFRPEGVLYDCFALVVSSSIIYLIMLVFDIQSDRRHKVFTLRKNEGLSSKNYADYIISSSALSEPEKGEKILIAVFLMSIIIIYGILFYFKHIS